MNIAATHQQEYTNIHRGTCGYAAAHCQRLLHELEKPQNLWHSKYQFSRKISNLNYPPTFFFQSRSRISPHSLHGKHINGIKRVNRNKRSSLVTTEVLFCNVHRRSSNWQPSRLLSHNPHGHSCTVDSKRVPIRRS